MICNKKMLNIFSPIQQPIDGYFQLISEFWELPLIQYAVIEKVLDDLRRLSNLP